MVKNNKNDLQLRLFTDEIMIASLYNTIKDIVKSIDKKAKINSWEDWYKDCEKTAKAILESESDKNGN